MEKRNDLIDQLIAQYAAYGATMGPVNIFGIQDESGQKDDVFNDWRGVHVKTTGDIFLCKATTNPGRHTTETAPGGAGHMAYGFQDQVWVIDTHSPSNPSFAHEGLCQRPLRGCGAIRYWRDVDREYVYKDKYPIESSKEVYMNFHRASVQQNTPKIGDYSAGCQVAQNHADHEQQISIIKSVPEVILTRQLTKDGRTIWTYLFSYLLTSMEDWQL